MVARGEYTKNHEIIYFKRVSFMVCELYLSLEKKEGSDFGEFLS